MAIERKFVSQNLREFRIKQFVEASLDRVGLSDVKLKKTPLGDKIIVYASRPGLVVGRGGANIQMLTRTLKEEFDLDNPQIEIEEVPKPDLDPDIVAERIANSLERFGSGKTKGIGHRSMTDTMNAGALGVEILISGKIPSMRARSWRFYAGYLKKAGDLAVSGVRKSTKNVTLKSGDVGVKVSIMPPDIVLPDNMALTSSVQQVVEETTVDETEKLTEMNLEKEKSAAEVVESTEETVEEAAAPVEETQETKKDVSVPESETSGTEEKQ